jgi:uncharacterized membrane protein
MNRTAPRSIAAYLQQLRAELAGQDAALIQDALYDAEEYLRAEVAAHGDKSEADVLELIASTYGSPEEVANAYRDTETRLKAALSTPRRIPQNARGRFFGIYFDPRAYTSLFFMFLSLVTGIAYFVLAVVGLSLSAGLAVLVIGVPFFLLFIAMTRAVSLGEGRLIEAVTGERMPRRPLYTGHARGWGARIGAMLKDLRTWTTLAYLLLMLPIGIVYFTIAACGVILSTGLIVAPLLDFAGRLGLIDRLSDHVFVQMNPVWFWDAWWAMVLLFIVGVLLLTLVMHLARGIGRLHARFAKLLLVSRSAPAANDTVGVEQSAIVA